MTRVFDVIIERDEQGYYVGTVPELPGCHTQAKSLDKLMERIREAIQLCLEVKGFPFIPIEEMRLRRRTVRAPTPCDGV